MKKLIFLVSFVAFVFWACGKSLPTSPSEISAITKPTVEYFQVSPSTINKGQSCTLSWEVRGTTTKISLYVPGFIQENVSAEGIKTFSPDIPGEHKCYLTAYNNEVYAEAFCCVKVEAPAEVVISNERYRSLYGIGVGNIFRIDCTVKNVGTKTANKVKLHYRFWKKKAWGGGLYKEMWTWLDTTDIFSFLPGGEEKEWWHLFRGDEGYNLCKYVDTNRPDIYVTWD